MKKPLRKQISAAVACLKPLTYRALWYESFRSRGRSHYEYFGVNHIRRAKRAYVRGGWIAVQRYIDLHPKKEVNRTLSTPEPKATATKHPLQNTEALTRASVLTPKPQKHTLLTRLFNWIKKLFR